jgi:hypothetical protein
VRLALMLVLLRRATAGQWWSCSSNLSQLDLTACLACGALPAAGFVLNTLLPLLQCTITQRDERRNDKWKKKQGINTNANGS